MLSARDPDYNLPQVFISLAMKAVLSYPPGRVYSEEERRVYNTDLMPLVIGPLQDESGWRRAGLGGLSYRDKADKLIEYEKTYRNWISYYPIDGLYSLLREGVRLGRDAQEKNWCALQLALTTLQERGGNDEVKPIMARLLKGSDGNVIIAEQDKELYYTVNTLVAKRQRERVTSMAGAVGAGKVMGPEQPRIKG